MPELKHTVIDSVQSFGIALDEVRTAQKEFAT